MINRCQSHHLLTHTFTLIHYHIQENMIDVDHILCSKCGFDEGEDDDVLFCDHKGCCRAYHQKCLDPPIVQFNADPNVDWFCWQCETMDDMLDLVEEYLDGIQVHHWEELFPEVKQLGEMGVQGGGEDEEEDESDDEDYEEPKSKRKREGGEDEGVEEDDDDSEDDDDDDSEDDSNDDDGDDDEEEEDEEQDENDDDGEGEEDSDIDEIDDDEVMKLLEEAGGDGENALDEGLGLGLGDAQGPGLAPGFMKAGKRLRDSTRVKASTLSSPGLSAGSERGSGGVVVVQPQVCMSSSFMTYSFLSYCDLLMT